MSGAAGRPAGGPGREKSGLIRRYRLLGLYLFVAIPLPGTGAWTGALIAALLDIRLLTAFPAILGGVATAGAIMYLLSLGVGNVIG